MITEEMIIMNELNNFTSYLKLEKDLSDNSIQSYISDIKQFINFANKDLKDVDTSDVRSFILTLTEKGRKRTTIGRVLVSLKSFYKYLREVEKSILNDPTDNIKIDSREKSLPKALSKSDVMKILAESDKEGIKSRLIVELLYGLGGRVTEVCSIKVEDVDFEDSYIRIKSGKGNKERHNPIHDGCIDLIKRYMKAYSIESGYLFPHRHDSSKHQTRAGVLKTVKRVAEKAGVDKDKVSPHVFRHSFATHMLDEGCDMALLQEFLGHEDISTTKIYAKVTRGNKSRNFQKFHPLA